MDKVPPIQPKSKTMQALDNFSQLYKGLEHTSKVIQTFINKHSEKYQKTEMFKVLCSLFDLFQSEITAGMQLRETVFKQKQEIKALKGDYQTFLKLFSSMANTEITTMKNAKEFVENFKLPSISSFNALQQNQTELVIEKQRTTQLLAENEEIKQKLANMSRNIQNIEENYKQKLSKITTDSKNIQLQNTKLLQDEEVLRKENDQLKSDITKLKQAYLDKINTETSKRVQTLKQENLQLKEEIDQLKQKNKSFVDQYASSIGNSPSKKIRKVATKSSPDSFRKLIILGIFCVKLLKTRNISEVEILKEEIQKTKSKLEQMDNW
ncbi:hypothetical protein TVAG_031340 [Trichomonas vaginalis G3]|uniref:Uncharacterized protein n=1 Tax=Trichomonas vaginalis (strain ATCC PRA-98 / G3) TaxID=412133 RepID=A2FKY0_TRIV3|nr:hypothetical protein TVAGG3_0198030 [Trichomonas vaginalis G3]EAX94434.1 hypothetical protein TVAG_031340 [Trichomonas vaginalis G3]KAI5550429.1 hypothetical protein TVAGG3_0198030 [Trichomonas vaginalis G3]|eukprot:XP_001307364.1 hypothetical protein [Trichomonas vaginalis G3]